EAIYAEVPWMRRRELHHRLATAIEASGGPGREVARHWAGADDAPRARAALVRAARESEELSAHRDAAGARPQAAWPGPAGGAGDAGALWPLRGARGRARRRGKSLA